MIDGNRILETARGLAFPRYPGSDGDARAIEQLAEELGSFGLDTTCEWFSYDIRPAERALTTMLVAAAVLAGIAGLLAPSRPGVALVLVAVALAPAATLAGWSPWLQRLYAGDGPRRTANVVARTAAAEPRMTVILMAHHDSKSQSLSLPARMGLTVLALLAASELVLVLVATLVLGRPVAPEWLAPASGGVAALALLGLSTLRSGNRSPGAVDNAGSVAIMLELARLLPPELAADVELVVLLTGAEEDHMVGAMRWLDAHAAELEDRPVYCLNLDGVGAPGRLVLIERYGFGRRFSSRLSALARQAAARLGISPRGILMPPAMGIDAIPFAHRGIDCLTLASGSLGRATMSVHSARDVAENLDQQALLAGARLVAELVRILTREPA